MEGPGCSPARVCRIARAGLKPGLRRRVTGLAAVVSDDVDASLASVEAAGGRVVTPIEAYPGGRRFTFADPAGTVLGVFQTD